MTQLAPALLGAILLALSPSLCAQDVMHYGLSHWSVLAEDGDVRVLRYAAPKGIRTPVHSHPKTVVYVVKGGRIRIVLPDGTVNERKFASGATFIRAAETHADEALDDLEFILVELKR